jgi:hypothetical protein
VLTPALSSGFDAMLKALLAVTAVLGSGSLFSQAPHENEASAAFSHHLKQQFKRVRSLPMT